MTLFTYSFTFTFMHLADAFIQSDLHCIQVTVLNFFFFFFFLSALAFPGNRTHDLGVPSAMLYHLSYRKARESRYSLPALLLFIFTGVWKSLSFSCLSSSSIAEP